MRGTRADNLSILRGLLLSNACKRVFSLDSRLTDQIETARERALDPARPDIVAAVHARGRMTARERLARLLDADSLIEYGALAGETTAPDDAQPADGLVGGPGLIGGHPVVAASYDATVRSGTQSDRNQRKMARLIYLAVTHRWPFVCFIDGDGARPTDPLPPPPILVAPRGKWGLYDGLAELSGWAPTVAVLSGRALDGHVGIAMLSDFVVATGDSEFGGRTDGEAPDVVPATTYAAEGNVDLIVDDEVAAIDAARRYLGFYLDADGDRSSITADPGAQHIAEVVPDNRRRPYDMRRIVRAFADADSTLELGAAWGRSMLTVLARLGGRTVGIFANQPRSPLAGAIDAAAADKAARFVELCDAYDFPLVSFIDNPGYMVGPQAERDGIARHHARPLAALHARTVPLASVQVRKAYGLGPYAMSGWGSSRVVPDLRLAWPSVESGGMSLEGAAFLVKRKEIQSAETPAEALAIRDAYAEKMRDSASGLRAGRGFMYDDIVAPADTRARIMALFDRLPRRLSTHKKHPIDSR